MKHFEFIEYPVSEDDILDMYIKKLSNREIHVLLCVTVHELSIKELVKVVLNNGLDGVLVSEIRNNNDVTYTSALYSYLQKLPVPYNTFSWDIIASVKDGCSYTELEKAGITGVISNGSYIQFKIPALLNNIDYHSTRLSNMKNRCSIDDILEYYYTVAL